MIQIIATNRMAMLSIKLIIGKGRRLRKVWYWGNSHLRSRMSDEDEESNSMESDPIPGFGILQVDDKNANCGAQGKRAMKRRFHILNWFLYL